MPIVDTHCHASLAWFEPVESLLFQMDRNRVERAALIQIRNHYNNDYIFDCAQRYPDRLVPVVGVDVSRPDATRELERLAERGARGIRLTPTDRSPGEDPLAIWRTAERLRLPVSCLGTGAQFGSDEFPSVFEAVPNLPIVIEHLGSALEPPSAAGAEARRNVFGLSRYPNAFIKVPGLGEFSQRAIPVTEPFPFVQPIPPYLEWAYEAFGPERMMWGSDYPPSGGREGYQRALQLCMAEFSHIARSDGDRDAIFGQTALRVFWRT
jgi:L-fuconolactonase